MINDRTVAWEEDVAGGNFACDQDLCRTVVLAISVSSDGSDGRDGINRPYIFRSYSAGQRDVRNPQEDGSNASIASICRATSAMPGFFKCVEIGNQKFRDGAIWSANPTLEIFHEVEELFPNQHNPIQILVSIGCGRPKTGRPFSISKASKLRWNDGLAERGLKDKREVDFFNFEGPSDLRDLEINEWRADGYGKKTFGRIELPAEKFCDSHPTKLRLRECARLLVATRQQRAETTRWERYALGMKYICWYSLKNESHKGPTQFEDRDSYLDHLLRYHDEPEDAKNWNKIQELLKNSQTTTIR